MELRRESPADSRTSLGDKSWWDNCVSSESVSSCYCDVSRAKCPHRGLKVTGKIGLHQEVDARVWTESKGNSVETL